MDAGFYGSIATVLFFLVFIGIIWWAFHRENKQKFNDAAQLPFQEEGDKPDETGKAPN
jgi:cytochrome c oxidase cbb3-type subunit IV